MNHAVVGSAYRMLADEARALLTRLETVQPFALQMTMVPAAAVPARALAAIEQHVARVRIAVGQQVRDYLSWLARACRGGVSPAEAQSGLALLRIRFNQLLSQYDIFADVLSQRSEHDNGIWLAGLDAAAADAMALRGGFFVPPPAVCYLDRGRGAAIRRARTRLPGGDPNPVAVVRVPRERMVGSGIASSLVHEVGHQCSASLGLVESLRPLVQGMQRTRGPDRIAWVLFERWLSEVIADFWGVAKVGIAATTGLIGVVSLPSAFVFRVALDDPHPFPWIRVKISCALGKALYPHSQWNKLAALWESFYPTDGLEEQKRRLLTMLESNLGAFVNMLVLHRPKALCGHSLMEVVASPDRHARHLQGLYTSWRATPRLMRLASPTLALAAVGQARFDGRMSPEHESRTVGALLRHWALRGHGPGQTARTTAVRMNSESAVSIQQE